MFEDLPPKARKRRRREHSHHHGSATRSVLDPTPTSTTVTPMVHAPGTGVGIAHLDTSLLGGSQRIGIIGLPGTGKSTCCKSLLSDLGIHYPVARGGDGLSSNPPRPHQCLQWIGGRQSLLQSLYS